MEKKPEPDPEAILKALELQLSAAKEQRVPKDQSRTAFRVGSIIVIVVLFLGAMIALEYAAKMMRSEPLPSSEMSTK